MAYCDEVDRPYLTVKEEEHDAPERTDEARDDEDCLLLRAVQHNADDEPHRNRGEDEAEHKDTGGKRVAGDLEDDHEQRKEKGVLRSESQPMRYPEVGETRVPEQRPRAHDFADARVEPRGLVLRFVADRHWASSSGPRGMNAVTRFAETLRSSRTRREQAR